jgi:hypothetical protein
MVGRAKRALTGVFRGRSPQSAPQSDETRTGGHFCEPRFRPAQDLPSALPSESKFKKSLILLERVKGIEPSS